MFAWFSVERTLPRRAAGPGFLPLVPLLPTNLFSPFSLCQPMRTPAGRYVPGSLPGVGQVLHPAGRPPLDRPGPRWGPWPLGSSIGASDLLCPGSAFLSSSRTRHHRHRGTRPSGSSQCWSPPWPCSAHCVTLAELALLVLCCSSQMAMPVSRGSPPLLSLWMSL